MKIVLFNGGRPGLLKDGGVVDISDAVARLGVQSGQAAMEAIITHMDSLRDDLSRMERQGSVTPLSEVSLPWPPVQYGNTPALDKIRQFRQAGGFVPGNGTTE